VQHIYTRRLVLAISAVLVALALLFAWARTM
jgi:hypothetical protein